MPDGSAKRVDGPISGGSGIATLHPTDSPADGTFEAMFRALDDSSAPTIGRADRQLLVIPIHDDGGTVVGGLWGMTIFSWLHVLFLVIPEPVRGRGAGTVLLRLAEAEAMRRGCVGAFVETLSFQAVGFYQSRGYSPYGEIEGFPPGHQRIHLCKRFNGDEAQESAPRSAPGHAETRGGG